MPSEVDKQVQAIIKNCMKKGGKTKKECEKMAWAIVNSKKGEDVDQTYIDSMLNLLDGENEDNLR